MKRIDKAHNIREYFYVHSDLINHYIEYTKKVGIKSATGYFILKKMQSEVGCDFKLKEFTKQLRLFIQNKKGD